MPLIRTAGYRFPLNLHRAYNSQQGPVPGSKNGKVLVRSHAYARGSSESNALWRVKPGNLVKFTTPRGRVLKYRVVRVNTHAPVHLSERKLAEYSSHHGPAMTIISTCNARTYNFAKKKYTDGVLIFAKRVRA